jgi:hypothetical protein
MRALRCACSAGVSGFGAAGAEQREGENGRGENVAQAAVLQLECDEAA